MAAIRHTAVMDVSSVLFVDTAGRAIGRVDIQSTVSATCEVSVIKHTKSNYTDYKHLISFSNLCMPIFLTLNILATERHSIASTPTFP